MLIRSRERHGMGVNDKFSKVTQYLSNYQGIRTKKFERLIKATETSYNEIISRIEEVVDSPKPLQLIGLVKTLTNSGVWISRSMLQYLVATVDFSTPIKEKIETERAPTFSKESHRICLLKILVLQRKRYSKLFTMSLSLPTTIRIMKPI